MVKGLHHFFYPRGMGPGVMKITQFWDRFYHLESVPHIKCQGIWFQVSGVGFQIAAICILHILTPDTRHLISKDSATEQNSEDFSGQSCDNFHHPRCGLYSKDMFASRAEHGNGKKCKSTAFALLQQIAPKSVKIRNFHFP